MVTCIRGMSCVEMWGATRGGVPVVKHRCTLSQQTAAATAAVPVRVLRAAFALDHLLFLECLSANEQRHHLVSLPAMKARGLPGPTILTIHTSIPASPVPAGAAPLYDLRSRTTCPMMALIYGPFGVYLNRGSTHAAPSSSSSTPALLMRHPTLSARQLGPPHEAVFLAVVTATATDLGVEGRYLYLWHVDGGPLWRTPLAAATVAVLPLWRLAPADARRLAAAIDTRGRAQGSGSGGTREVVIDSDSDADSDGDDSVSERPDDPATFGPTGVVLRGSGSGVAGEVRGWGARGVVSLREKRARHEHALESSSSSSSGGTLPGGGPRRFELKVDLQALACAEARGLGEGSDGGWGLQGARRFHQLQVRPL